MTETTNIQVKRILDPSHSSTRNSTPKTVHTESSFRWAMNEDEMATVKTAEGIRNFAKDLVKLEGQIGALLKQ